MPRLTNRLVAVKLKNLRPGRYGDGNNLFFVVTATHARSWLFIFRSPTHGRQREMGLGGLNSVSLATARLKAIELRGLIEQGIDPIDARDTDRQQSKLAATKAIKFRDFAEQYVRNKQGGWKNQKHRAQWTATLEQHAFPVLGDVVLADIDKGLLLQVLRPIWSEIPETASRLRARLERILAAAKSDNLRSGDNPAQWRDGLEHDLPSRSKVRQVRHHPALPYSELPGFVAELRQRNSISAQGLLFTILTAARSGEVIGATWKEVSLEKKEWIIPAHRMKGGREHRVPLSQEALAILKAVRFRDSSPDDFIFPGWNAEGRSGTRPLSNMALLECARQIKPGITVHGMRSTFSDWVGDETTFDSETREFSLAHVKGDKAEAAYRRLTSLKKRAALMSAWADYCLSACTAAQKDHPKRRGPGRPDGSTSKNLTTLDTLNAAAFIRSQMRSWLRVNDPETLSFWDKRKQLFPATAVPKAVRDRIFKEAESSGSFPKANWPRVRKLFSTAKDGRQIKRAPVAEHERRKRGLSV
jgi:integrase